MYVCTYINMYVVYSLNKPAAGPQESIKGKKSIAPETNNSHSHG